MGVAYNSRIITDGLVLALDAANPRNFNLTAVEVLVVGGGGGGSVGTNGGGGGGAGGFRTETAFPITPGVEISVTVGDGGSGSVGRGLGTNGGNSVFSTIISTGGGRGGGSGNGQGANGGSGGGAMYSGAGGSSSPVTSPSQGFAGGSGALYLNRPYEADQGGGGGGASEAGSDGPGSSGPGGKGGNGLPSSISGTLVTYAGGGGGSTNDTTTTSLGGSGGGGFGASTSPKTGGNGGVNLGGGGGAGNGGGGNSGAGGSGIIIVRYPGPQKAIGGVVTSVGGDTIHTFTTVGSTTFTPLVNTNGSAVLGLSDLSGNRNFGKSEGGVLYSSVNGGSLYFEGSDEYVNVSQLSSAFQVSQGSIESWIKPSSDGTDQMVCGLGGNETTGATRVIRINGSQWGYVGYGSVNEDWGSIAPVAFNTWAHVVIGWNGTALTFWLNGTRYDAIRSGIVTPNSSVIRLGVSTWNTSDRPFEGNIATFRMYSKLLSNAEVSQNFNALRGRFGL